jgi:hypothetical protein
VASYDLSEFRALPWVRVTPWFRVGLGAFAAAALALTAYGFLVRVWGGGIGIETAVGTGLIFAILGSMLVVSLLMRPSARGITIDEDGVRLDYGSGRQVTIQWGPQTEVIRGRRTEGTPDFISRGRPLSSIYGRFGGLSETFISQPAFQELLASSQSHGYEIRETDAGAGWYVYSLRRQ